MGVLGGLVLLLWLVFWCLHSFCLVCYYLCGFWVGWVLCVGWLVEVCCLVFCCVRVLVFYGLFWLGVGWFGWVCVGVDCGLVLMFVI